MGIVRVNTLLTFGRNPTMPAYNTTSLDDTPYGKSLRECAQFANHKLPEMAVQLHRLGEAGLVDLTEPELLTVYRELVTGLTTVVLSITHQSDPSLTPAAIQCLARAAIGAVVQAGLTLVLPAHQPGHA